MDVVFLITTKKASESRKTRKKSNLAAALAF